jgi:hypothetical protein
MHYKETYPLVDLYEMCIKFNELYGLYSSVSGENQLI